MKNKLFFWLLLVSLLSACSGGQIASGPRATPLILSGPNPRLQPNRTRAPEPTRTTASRSSAASTPIPTAAQTTTLTLTSTQPPPPLEAIVEWIPAPSLEGNLIGDPNQQPLQIYLPPSYRNSDLRYPVVYFLPGFGSNTDGDNLIFDPARLAGLIADGTLEEAILVVPNGANLLGGGFYVNSSVTGNWEDFILKDVLGYMDANYRTLPEAQGRGIAGHSMGGFGAFNLAMRHPDLFGAVYTLSAGLFDENGLGDSHMFNEKKKIAHLSQTFAELNLMPVDEALKEMSKYDGAIGFTVAYGTAFAPDPDHGPPYFDYPFDEVDGEMVKNRTVWRQWEEGFGAWPAKIKQYQDNLQKLSGIVFDYGAADAYSWIPRGNEYLSSQLSAAGIANQLYRFDGGHSDKMEERLLTVMLPFFNRVLADPQ